MARTRAAGRRRWWVLVLGVGLLLGGLAAGCDATCEKVQTRRQRCAENEGQAKAIQKAQEATKAQCKKDTSRLQECLALKSCEDFSACTDRVLGTRSSAAR